MLDRRRLLAICISLSLIGVLGLFVYSTTIEPVELDIGDIGSSQVGSVVVTSGTINQVRTLSDGSLSMSLCDVRTGSEIRVYFPIDAYEDWSGGELIPGTCIRVCGEVELYQESLEMSVASSEDVEVISEAGELELPLWQILGSIEVMEGMEVVTNGTVHDLEIITSGEELVGTCFELTSAFRNRTYSIECMAFDRDLSANITEWDIVSVQGTLGYYVNGGRWQLVVTELAVLIPAYRHK